jgi:DNA-binding XRE family transcriptional regulator
MAKTGRPSLFSETHQKIAFAMAKLGATDKQISVEIGITEQTFNNWKKEYPSFFESLKTAKQEADEKVEKALYKLATGYKYKAKKPMVVSMGQGLGSEIEIAEYDEVVQPNTTACIFWLKNRKPAEWRDKQEIQHSGGISVNLAPLDETL